MKEKIFIYIHDKYGNPGSYATTFSMLQSDCKEINDEIVLYESFDDDYCNESGEYLDVIIDQDGDVIAVEATLETVEEFSPVDDPKNLIKNYLTS